MSHTSVNWNVQVFSPLTFGMKVSTYIHIALIHILPVKMIKRYRLLMLAVILMFLLVVFTNILITQYGISY